jgi:excisionase family DNA binding protein
MTNHHIEVKRVFHKRIYVRRVPINGFLEPPEAAAFLHMGLRHVYRLLDDGKLAALYRRNKRLIPCRAVLDYKRKGKS